MRIMRNQFFLTCIWVFLLFPVVSCSSDGKTEIFDDKSVRGILTAIDDKDGERIREFLLQGVDLNYMGKGDLTPLLWAAGLENRRMFLKLLELGADPNLIRPVDRDTTMVMLGRHKDVWYLAAALERGGDPNLISPSTNRTPIFYCLSSEKVDCLSALLEGGANIDHIDGGGRSPVMVAAMLKYFSTVRLLLENGANYEIIDISGLSLRDRLESAVDDGFTDDDLNFALAFVNRVN